MPKEHDKIVCKLLFELATWHALAKLRLHTETTLIDLENSTTRLGQYIRSFETLVCPEYNTRELPSEVGARNRRQASKAAKVAQSSSAPKHARRIGAKIKTFNTRVYKLHSLGDYAKSIRLHGTTDSYNTQLVS